MYLEGVCLGEFCLEGGLPRGGSLRGGLPRGVLPRGDLPPDAGSALPPCEQTDTSENVTLPCGR